MTGICVKSGDVVVVIMAGTLFDRCIVHLTVTYRNHYSSDVCDVMDMKEIEHHLKYVAWLPNLTC